MRQRHEMKKTEKINLVPIMDAVFIFIFFLLMSAQFVNVYEIGSSVPMVKEMPEDKIKKDPLKLVLEIHATSVVVRQGTSARQVGVFNDSEWEKLRQMLASLKARHPDERVAMLRPQGQIPFHRLVKVIDHVKEHKQSKMFDEIVFDGKGAM